MIILKYTIPLASGLKKLVHVTFFTVNQKSIEWSLYRCNVKFDSNLKKINPSLKYHRYCTCSWYSTENMTEHSPVVGSDKFREMTLSIVLNVPSFLEVHYFYLNELTIVLSWVSQYYRCLCFRNHYQRMFILWTRYYYRSRQNRSLLNLNFMKFQDEYCFVVYSPCNYNVCHSGKNIATFY